MSVFKAIELPGLEFATKEEMFLGLKANAEKIIAIKVAQVYKSCEKGQISMVNAKMIGEATKGQIAAKEGFIYPVISTTRYRDSHKDCHFDGCFTETVKDQQGNIVYALDHQLKYDSILAWQENVKMFVQSIDWGIVGKEFSGETEALIFEIAKKDIRKADVLKDIEERANKFQNSIRMRYHVIKLGVDSSDKSLTTEKAYYDSRIDSIANKDVVKEDGYFWGVEQLGIYKEGSLVVAGGSNDATTIFTKDIEPDDTTQVKEHGETPPKKESDEKASFDINKYFY